MADLIQKENMEMVEDMTGLQEIHLDPIKIKGKDGARSRRLREDIHQLIGENEDLRLAVGRMWLNEQPTPTPADKTLYTDQLSENHKLRTNTLKLKHLGSDLQDLETSIKYLEEQNNQLRAAYANFKYQKVLLPKELDVVSREVEGLSKQVSDASKKKTPPPNLLNAKSYVSYMGQVLSAMSSIHQFGESNVFGKLDIASDVFMDMAPKSSSVPPSVEEKLRNGRAKFEELKTSLGNKWSQLKSLSEPENIKAAGRDTLAKMNRVIVNVVSKLKEIGQSTLLKRGKTPVDRTVSALTEKLTVLDTHFDITWDELESEVDLNAVDKELAKEMMEDDPEDEIGSPVENSVEESIVYKVDTKKNTKTNAKSDTKTDAKSDTKTKIKPETKTKIKPETKIKTKANTKTETKTKEVKVASAKDSLLIVKSKTPNLSKKNENNIGKLKDNISAKSDKTTRNIDKKKNKTNEKVKSEKVISNKTKSMSKELTKTEKKVDNKPKREKEIKKNNSSDNVKDKDNSNNIRVASNKSTHKKNDKNVDDGRYFKGHYNKDKSSSKDKPKKIKDVQNKRFKSRDTDKDDDDKHKSKIQKSSLRRHWEKPAKKTYFRQSSDRRQFIRRKGKKVNGNQVKFKKRDGKWQKLDTDNNLKESNLIGYKQTNIALGGKRNINTKRRVIKAVRKFNLKAKKFEKKIGEQKRNYSSNKIVEPMRVENGHSNKDDHKDSRKSWQQAKTQLRRDLHTTQRILKQKQAEQRRRKRSNWRTYKRSIDRSDSDNDEDDYDYYGEGGRFKKRIDNQKSKSKFSSKQHGNIR